MRTYLHFKKLKRGAKLINKVNDLYLKGSKRSIKRAERIKGRIARIKDVSVTHMVFHAKDLRRG